MSSRALCWRFNSVYILPFKCTITLAHPSRTNSIWYASDMPLGHISVFRKTFSFEHGMDTFSGISHSIGAFESYKIVYFPGWKNTGHLRTYIAHCHWIMIFCFFDWYFTDFDQKTTICIETNNIFGITIQNWSG